MKNYFTYSSSQNRRRLFTSIDIADKYIAEQSKEKEVWVFNGTSFAHKRDIVEITAGAFRYKTKGEIEKDALETQSQF
jgi:hypothetical protein